MNDEQRDETFTLEFKCKCGGAIADRYARQYIALGCSTGLCRACCYRKYCVEPARNRKPSKRKAEKLREQQIEGLRILSDLT